MDRNFKAIATFGMAGALLLASGAAMAQGKASAAAPAAGGSDHDAMVGHLAVGYLGHRSLSIGNEIVTGANPVIQAPVVGVRYWIDPLLGLDLGLGLAFGSGSAKVDAANAADNTDSRMGLLFHAGVPLALGSVKHFTFLIVPEMNVGFGSRTQEVTNGGTKMVDSGVHFDLGARAGAEIHFGFIGIPQLSLQGSVGLRLDVASGSNEATTATDPATGARVTTKTNYSGFGVRTDTYENPWNIFTTNIAALYYF